MMLNLFIGSAILFSSFSYQLNDIYVGGENIVFEIKPEGIIVTGTYDIKTNLGTYNPLRDSDIQIGDIIISIDNKEIHSIKDFLDEFNKKENNSSVNLKIIRNEAEITRKLNVNKIDNQSKSGLFVKERVLGVGTLTFIDTDLNIYGALGHEVVDSSSSQILSVYDGNIYKEEVVNISKGTNGHPGEKSSTTKLNHKLGTIFDNTDYGIFGNIDSSYNSSYSTKLAEIDEIKLGKAYILTCIEENKVEKFEIEIIDLKRQNNQDLKGITFKITDPRLLNVSGGVFSGMSGSPIIQNDKLIGAVTHVIVNDVKCGYGVYIKYMYQEAVESMKKEEK